MKTMLTNRFDRALAFAAVLHREQLRKGTEIPYVAHLLGVASIALEHGADEDEAIAALLHDSIEDQSRGDAASLRSGIREEFGERVLTIVEGCTDADVIPKPPWRERKADYLAHLAQAPRSVLLVSASDKLHNARSNCGGFAESRSGCLGAFQGRSRGIALVLSLPCRDV